MNPPLAHCYSDPASAIECGNPGKLFQSLRDCSVVAPLATEQVAVDHNALM